MSAVRDRCSTARAKTVLVALLSAALFLFSRQTHCVPSPDYSSMRFENRTIYRSTASGKYTPIRSKISRDHAETRCLSYRCDCVSNNNDLSHDERCCALLRVTRSVVPCELECVVVFFHFFATFLPFSLGGPPLRIQAMDFAKPWRRELCFQLRRAAFYFQLLCVIRIDDCQKVHRAF